MPSVAEQKEELPLPLPLADQNQPQLPPDAPPNFQPPLPPAKEIKKSTKGKAKSSGGGSIPPTRRPPPNTLRGGIIGVASADPPAPAWLPAGGGARKALPEYVLPFKLPTLTDKAATGEGGSDSSQETDESSEQSDGGDGHAVRRKTMRRIKRKERKAYERSLLQIQSLRQSRLFYLASLLAPYYRRTKAGIMYSHSIPPELLHNIDPSLKGSHVLALLPRIEVQVGPHVFTKTKLWEMKKERELPAMPTTQSAPTKKAQAAPGQALKPQPSLKAAPRPPQPPQQPRPPQPPAPRPAPPTAAATAAVDPVLVTRVNERASKDADLRDLLQVAARGAATPDQLRVLGEVIQDVTREMERDGLRVMPPQPMMRAPAPVNPVPTSAPTSVAGPSTPRPKASIIKSQKQKTPVVGGPDKRTGSVQVDSAGETRPEGDAPFSEHVHSPPAAHLAASSKKSATAPPTAPLVPLPPFRPPILILEFRENTSMRFYAPLWTSLVTRRRLKRAREVSDGGEEEEELTEEPTAIQEQVDFVEVQLQFLGPISGSDAALGTGGEGRYPISMIWTAEDPSNTLWEAIGRVPGVRTLDTHGREVSSGPDAIEGDDQRAEEGTKGKLAMEELEQAIFNAIASLPPQQYLNLAGPLPRGLEDHLADKFAPQLQTNTLLSTSSANAHSHGGIKRRPSPLDVVWDDLQDGSGDGSFLTAPNASTAYASNTAVGDMADPGSAPKPKKKRNVATHNSDGTLKRCNACGTNVTPMWRRGPDGPATLCNACGARWKSGRLGMPSARGGRRGSASGVGCGTTAVTEGGDEEVGTGKGEGEVDQERQGSDAAIPPDRHQVSGTQEEMDQQLQQRGQILATVEKKTVGQSGDAVSWLVPRSSPLPQPASSELPSLPMGDKVASTTQESQATAVASNHVQGQIAEHGSQYRVYD